MKVECVWEHNDNDTLLYALNYPGVFTRGAGKEEALQKMAKEIKSYASWLSEKVPEVTDVKIVQAAPCDL